MQGARMEAVLEQDAVYERCVTSVITQPDPGSCGKEHPDARDRHQDRAHRSIRLIDRIGQQDLAQADEPVAVQPQEELNRRQARPRPPQAPPRGDA